MRSMSNVIAISRLQWQKTLHRTQFWIVIVLVPLLAYRYMSPVLRFTQATGIDASPVGLAFFLSDYSFSLVLSLGLVLLLAQAPFMDEQMTYVLLRCENVNWYIGSILYCVEISLAYIAYWCVCLLIPLVGHIELCLDWGKIWNTLCQTSAYYDYSIMVKMPFALMAYKGGEALLLSVMLKFIYCSFLASIVFIGNTPWRVPCGTTASILLLLQDYFAMNGHGYAYYWYSPSTMSRLSMLDSTDTFLQPCPREAILVLVAFTAMVVAVGGLICVRIDVNKNSKS